MAEEKITRTKLYELIWSEPRFSIAKKFNITDAELMKICKQLKIPVPKPGHWQRKKFNRDAQAPVLPTDYSGEQEITLPSRPVGEIVESPIKILQRQIENDASVKLSVPKKLATLDKLILQAKAGLEERKKSGWSNNGLLNNRDGLEISVSPQNIDRALRFMDTLLKALYARGHSIEIDYHGSNIVITGQQINFSLIERSKRTIIEKDNWRTQQLEPTGKLAFRMKKKYDLREFIDGKTSLEDQLSRIIAELEIHGEELRLEKIEREKSWAKQKIEQENRERYMKLREKELTDFKTLLVQATRWRQTKMLRNYIDAIEAQSSVDTSTQEEMKKWIEWARNKADWYDPIVESEDELLIGVDRDRLQ